MVVCLPNRHRPRVPLSSSSRLAVDVEVEEVAVPVLSHCQSNSLRLEQIWGSLPLVLKAHTATGLSGESFPRVGNQGDLAHGCVVG